MFKNLFTGKVDPLLALRGIAALMVVVFHCGIIPRIGFLTPNGTVAVYVFFILSGYLMGKAFLANRYELNFKGITRFYKSRILRICPLYYFLTFLFIFWLHPFLLHPQNFTNLIKVLAFNFQHTQPFYFIATFWSLSVEMQFYLILPFFVLLLTKFIKTTKQRVALIIGLFGLIELYKYIAIHYFVEKSADLYNASTMLITDNLIPNLEFFLAGIAVNLLILNKDKLTWLNFPKIFSLLGLFVLYLTSSTGYFYSNYLAILAVMIYIFSYEKDAYNSSIKNTLSNHPLNTLGNLSYGVYLWHLPLSEQIHSTLLNQDIFIQIYMYHQTIFYFNFLFLTLLASISFAAMTYRFIEMPFNKLKFTNLNLKWHFQQRFSFQKS